MKKLICLVFCSLFLFTGCKNSSYFEVVQQKDESSSAENTGITYDSAVSSIIFVQVAGAVKNPGVYELPEGSRIFKAIEAAGGLAENADDSNINLAQSLKDGEKIYVFTIEELKEINSAVSTSTNTSDDGLININTATVSEFCKLPGIGESKAKQIVTYRDANGSFSSIADIKNVSGIGEGIYNQIQSLIKTD